MLEVCDILIVFVDVAVEVTYKIEVSFAHGEGVAVSLPIFHPSVGMVMGGICFPASTHPATRGKTALNMLASTPTSLMGGGRRGSLRLTPTSTESEMLASTRARGPRAIGERLVLFAYGADGAVVLLLFPTPQLST